MTPTNPRTVTETEWRAEGERLFGPDQMQWRFVCPVCGHVAAVQDWKNAGATEGAAAFSCVGRWIEGSKQAFTRGSGGPCNYAGGGLFRLNPVTVVRDGDPNTRTNVFEFDRTTTPKESIA